MQALKPILVTKIESNLTNKIQNEKDNIHKIHREVPLIQKFISSIEQYSVYKRNLEVQLEVFKFKIVEIFSENDCMKSMYKVLTLINDEIEYSKITKATGCLRNFRDYLQKRMFVTRDLDYLELLDYSSPKNNAIYEILWQMAMLEFASQNEEFRQVISSLIWMLYREIKLQNLQLDPEWLDFDKIQATAGDEKSCYDNMSQVGKRRYGDHESEIMSDHYSINRAFNKRSKNIITLNTGMKQPSQAHSKLGESVNKSEYSYGGSESKRKKYVEEGDYEDQNYNDDQIDLTDLEWQDACIKILSKLEEYDESEDFRNPVTREEVGEEYWQAYCSIIDYHVDFTTIRYKVLEGECKGISQFELDLKTVFSNCKKFNDPSSEIYSYAVFCEKLFHKLYKPVKKKFNEGDRLREHGINLKIGGINI